MVDAALHRYTGAGEREQNEAEGNTAALLPRLPQKKEKYQKKETKGET